MCVGIAYPGSFHSPTMRTTLFVELSSPVGISAAGMFGIESSVSRRSWSTCASSRSISAMRSPTLRISSFAAATSPPSLAILPISLDAAFRFAFSVSVSPTRARRLASSSRAFSNSPFSTPRRASAAAVASKSSLSLLMSIMFACLFSGNYTISPPDSLAGAVSRSVSAVSCFLWRRRRGGPWRTRASGCIRQ